MNLLLAIHTVLVSILLYSTWCRLAKMAMRTTYVKIRLAFVASAMVAVALGVAPWGHRLWPAWFPEYRVHFLVVCLLAAFVFVQVATSYHWRRGVPKQFVKE